MTASGAERKLCLHYACLRSLCSTKTSIVFRSLFIYQEGVKRAKRWMEWRLYQSQTNPRHAWQEEVLQHCCPHVMFYGCIVWLAGFPRGSVHGVSGVFQICQAYALHSQMSSFQPRQPCNIVLLGVAAGLRLRSCGIPQTLLISNDAVWFGHIWRRSSYWLQHDSIMDGRTMEFVLLGWTCGCPTSGSSPLWLTVCGYLLANSLPSLSK